MIEIATPGTGGEDVAMGAAPEIPVALPVLPLRDSVTFPDTLTPLAVGQERSIRLINDVLGGDRMLVMVASRDPDVESPGPEQLYSVGVVGTVARMLKVPDGTLRILVQAGPRVRLAAFPAEQPYLVAAVEEQPDVVREGPELTALMRNVQETFSRIIEDVPYLPEELQVAVANLEDPSALSHLIAGALRLKTDEKQELLEERDVARRLRRLSEFLARELEVAAIGSRIQSQVQSELDRTQREYVLRQQLKAIQEELGERDPTEAEVEELREQLDAVALPEDVRAPGRPRARAAGEAAPGRRGARRDPHLPRVARVAAVGHGHADDNLDLRHAREVLDADHFDIEKVKERILEFLAVRRLKPDAQRLDPLLRRPARRRQDVARQVDRPRARAASSCASRRRRARRGRDPRAPAHLHRRDARPIIHALRDAGSTNPLFMLDEIDKLGSDFRGDPASALLEVLDPEQNATFRDHYLDVPFDLSQVMFITTANTLDTIPGPLRDRMEVIQLAGYTEEEKLEIAKRYLVPRQIERNGLKRSQIAFSDTGLQADRLRVHARGGRAQPRARDRVGLPQGRPPRGRGHARAQGHGHRAARARAARTPARPARGAPADARAGRGDGPGLDAGRRRRPVRRGDGDAEPAQRPPALTVTGQLGDVMKESAQAALS